MDKHVTDVYVYGAPLIGRADASSSMTGRHRNITQVATNKEMGALGSAASEYKFAVSRERDAPDTRHRHNSRQGIGHAAEHSITGECARHELAKGPCCFGTLHFFLSVGKLCRSKFDW